MYEGTDGADDVIAVAGRYFAAMVDADEPELGRVFCPRASVVGRFDGACSAARGLRTRRGS
jgi:hypothetical protein